MNCVEIDGLTPCLIDNETGDIVETEVIRVKRKSFLSKYNMNTGWYVDWSDLLKENEIYAIVVKGTVAIQGLVAVRPDAEPICMLHQYQIFIPEESGKKIQEVYSNEFRCSS